MTELTLSGRVEAHVWDEQADQQGTVLIGGTDILRAINDTFEDVPRRVVTVAIADERFEGDLDLGFGSRGYSEYTPADPATLTAGPHNLLDILDRHDGQEITIWIADEPADLSRRNQEAAERKAQQFRERTTAYANEHARVMRRIDQREQEIVALSAAVERDRRLAAALADVVGRRAAGEDAHLASPRKTPTSVQ